MNHRVGRDARRIGAQVLPGRHCVLLQSPCTDLGTVILPTLVCIDSAKLIVCTYFHILLLVQRRAWKILLRVLVLVLTNSTSDFLLAIVLVQSNLFS